MDVLIALLKYTFVVALGLEVALIARALVGLARAKAGPAVSAAPAEE